VPRHAPKRRHNLPAQRIRLIGREQDVAAARQALLEADGRLLTLIGTGGCGKTRLALELATDLLPTFPDGVWLVELAPLADAHLVPQAVVSALGAREQPGERPEATLVRVLSSREALLVLDNCEHVIDVCAWIVSELLDRCPRLRVLATSREALRVPGELTWRVPSLGVPDQRAAPEQLLAAPAVQLFVERARARVPTFDPAVRLSAIGAICRRVDGLPLAIELAAARLPALGVDQILDRLNDSIALLVGGSRTAPTRQQTLRATLDWSYGLLGEGERAVFRRMAVFAGTCSLEAVEAVCAASDVVVTAVLDHLNHLFDKSLVVVEQDGGEARYQLLEPVRQYALARLVERGEREVVRRRHALYFVSFAEARGYESNVGGPRRFPATRELALEYPNNRAALAWSIEHSEAQLGLRLAGSLMFFWQIYGPVTESLAWLSQVIALPGADEQTAARGWAVLAASYLAQLCGDFDTAAAMCDEGAAIARVVARPELEWIAFLFRATQGLRTGDLASAKHFATQAAACSRAADLKRCETMSLVALSQCASEEGDYMAAQAFAEQALRISRHEYDALNEAAALHVAGWAALGQGNHHDARVWLEGALVVAQEMGEPRHTTSEVLDKLGELELASNQLARANECLARSLEMRYEGGERYGMVRTLARLAAVAVARAQPERALRLAGAADELCEALSLRSTAVERTLVERWLQPARDALTSKAANVAWAEGRAMALEDAIAFALQDAHTAPTPTASRRLPAASSLTAREAEVAVLVARGLSNPQIAAELVISVHTVQRHVENILGKLGFTSRTQVATWVVAQGLAVAPQDAGHVEQTEPAASRGMSSGAH
jgi:predicted ATPase/DNA-binding CsgD family transcriptional regulator